ncbi:hypothetical protein FG379_002875 [Cryptosporidium bovis]|uniref:uncharacterized protein n=1 Tax=Cryptosporidium bovis TaxID=310047 RepID=UPI00351A8F6D|nr:hypothetical protein FG379_002875 [Cryptosporidium bovis]
MPIKDGSTLLKIPDYCIGRRKKVSGLTAIEERVVGIKSENRHVNQQSSQITNKVYGDNLWDSPRVTPNFGIVEVGPKSESKKNGNNVLNRIPRINYVSENIEQNFSAGDNENSELDFEEPSGFVGCNVKSEPVTYPGTEHLDYGCSALGSRGCDENDFNYNEIDEYEDFDIPAPLVSSAPRFRLYDIEWGEKLRSSNIFSERIDHYQDEGKGNKEGNHNCDLLCGEQEIFLNKNHILDTIGIKGPKVFETENGEVTISEDGDFSFEFFGKEKLFTIKGGGCFITIKNGKYDQPYSDNNEEAEQVFHINDLKGGDLRRYTYGVRLCETIKSFIPKVKLKIAGEGIYTLMSDHPSYPSFQAEFISFHGVDNSNILKVSFLSGQDQVVFIPSQGMKKVKEPKVIIERSLLEKLGVCGEADLEFDDPEKNEYIVEKTHQISSCGLKWSAILRAWRLSLSRLLECRQLELKGLEKYSRLLDGLPEYIFEDTDNFTTSTVSWKMRKKTYEEVFPIIVEREIDRLTEGFD